MKALSLNKCNCIITLLDSGHFGAEIHSITGLSAGVISKTCAVYRPNLPKSAGGRPRKLSEAHVRHALRLISSREVENAVEVTRVLRNVTSANWQILRRPWGVYSASTGVYVDP